MTERIVVGFDGSDTSKSAVRWAAAAAADRQAALRIVGAYSVPLPTDSFGAGIPAAWADPAFYREECLKQLQGIADEVHAAHPALGVDTQAVHGPAGDVLVEAAEHATLVVVGSSGAGAAKSFLLGSVAAAVMHRSPRPVVVVPTKLPTETTGTIVVGVDGSAHAERALRWAVAETDRRGAVLRVVHAWQYMYLKTIEGDRLNTFADVDNAHVIGEALRLAREIGTGSVDGETVEGGAVQVLLDESESADLVVIGSRGRGGFRSMLFGSVAQNVAAHASCPVVVIR